MAWDPIALFEALEHSVAVYERDGTFVYVNAVSERIFGAPRDQLLGTRLWDRFPDAVGDPFHEAFNRVVETGRPEVFDHRYATGGRWYRSHVHALDGRIHVVAEDITDAKQAELRLLALARASHAFSRAVDLDELFSEIARSSAETMGDGCCVHRVNAAGTHLNLVAVHHTSIEGLALLREFFADPIPVGEGLSAKVFATDEPLLLPTIDPEVHRRAFRKQARRALVDEAGVHSLMAVPLRDGEQRIGIIAMMRDRTPSPYTASDLSLLQDLEDRAAMAVARARLYEQAEVGRRQASALASAERLARADAERTAELTRRLLSVTSRFSHRRTAPEIAETVLRESTASLGGSSAAIWLFDEAGEHLEMIANIGFREPARFARIPLGAPAPLCDAVKRNAPVYLSNSEEFGRMFPVSKERVGDAAPGEFATACLPLTTEGRVIGGLAFAFQSAHPFPEDERTFLEVLANQCAQALDRAQLLEQERAASAAAQAADRRKDEFLAMLGHELRNPLAPILTALQLMALKGVPGVEREREIIGRQTRHLVRLVDDLLDLSRITRGKVELRRARTDIAAVLAKAVEMASPLLEQRNHHLQILAPRGVCFVDGDEIRLAQVFQNLLTNAAKYTPPGGQITARLGLSGGSAVLEIEDNGDGIPGPFLPSIFDPFVQGERSIDRSQGGLGIGLALVRSLVVLHGGTVAAHSDGVGKGSRFVVSLPSAAGALEVAPPSSSEGPALAERGRRVLLVDDNEDAAELQAELLRAVGHEVLVAYDGPSALAEAGAFRPDVALLDIGLPVMDGYELARKLQSLLPQPLRLVALTGYGQENDRARSREAGFALHLVKPVDGARLLAAVDGDAGPIAPS